MVRADGPEPRARPDGFRPQLHDPHRPGRRRRTGAHRAALHGLLEGPRGGAAMTDEVLVDRVPREAPGSREIGFSVPERYNAASILFDNLERGLGDKVAVYSDAGNATYRDLARDAGRFGNALKALGLEPGARVAMVLDDTAAYPAAVFGALAAGFVPVLLNTASPPELLEYFLEDSGAPVLVIEGALAALVREGIGGRLAALRHVVMVDGEPGGQAGPAWHDLRTLLEAHD